MIKVLAACGNGMGSSMIIKMKIQKVLDELGVEAQVHHSSVGQAKSEAKDFDLVIVAKLFTKEFDVSGKTKVVGLTNLLDENEIKNKVKEALGL